VGTGPAAVPAFRYPSDPDVSIKGVAYRMETDQMTKLALNLPLLLSLLLTVTGIGLSQTFKVEKFDIKSDGGTDYISVESATGHVFFSRGTHVVVVEGPTGKVLGDIPDTPGVHDAGVATKAGHGFYHQRRRFDSHHV
jgi:hypothetical protein